MGRRVIDDYLDALSEPDASAIAAAMQDVREHGLTVARHLRGQIYEVRADGVDNSYRLLFAAEGRKSRILLGLHVIEKHTQQTPDRDIRKAERRLFEWRRRGRASRRA